MTDTASSLPGGRNCSAAMTGEGPVHGVDDRTGRPTVSVPQTGVRARSRKIVGQPSSIVAGARGVGKRTKEFRRCEASYYQTRESRNHIVFLKKSGGRGLEHAMK